jgi:hypothetical protein
MQLLAIDLAAKRHQDIGAAILSGDGKVHAQLIDQGHFSGLVEMSPEPLADLLVATAEDHRCNWIALDGPAGWKSASNPLEHSRLCDRAINAPAKVGLPGAVKPRTYTAFVQFSVRLFDALTDRGYPRLVHGAADPEDRKAMEIFPTACWSRLGLRTLPAKRKCKDVNVWARSLMGWVQFSSSPSHDQLQAVIGGIPALWLGTDNADMVDAVGSEPVFEDGHWREGYVLVTKKSVPTGSAKGGQS